MSRTGTLSAIVAWPLLAAALLSGPAQGQRGPAGVRECARGAGAAIIQGRVVNDSTGAPLVRRGVMLRDTGCFVTTDSTGAFRFTGVPGGRHQLAVGDLGYRRFTPVALELSGDTVVTVEIRLRPENLVADCREEPRCATILEAAPELPTDRLRLEEAVWRTAFAIAGMGSGERVPCADVESDVVREALQARFPRLAPVAECRQRDHEEDERRSIVHRASGAPAGVIRVASVEDAGDGTASARASYVFAALWGLGWRCRYVREGDQWEAEWCGTEWIS